MNDCGGGHSHQPYGPEENKREERERENERFWYLSTECVLLATAHIVLESCLISFTTPKKNTKRTTTTTNLLPSNGRRREREREPIAPPRMMMMMCHISKGFGFFPCGPT
jgi:hypothetical protein